MKSIQIVRVLAFLSLVGGLIALPGSSGLTNQPFDMVTLGFALILLVVGYIGLKTTETKSVEYTRSANIVNYVSMILVIFACVMFVGDIYNARAYLYIIFMLPGDIAGIQNNLSEFGFVFVPMVTSLLTLAGAVYLRRSNPVFIYAVAEDMEISRASATFTGYVPDNK